MIVRLSVALHDGVILARKNCSDLLLFAEMRGFRLPFIFIFA